jgi:polysaccharide chain length determinant protein (PEP-CTERM system associated)
MITSKALGLKTEFAPLSIAWTLWKQRWYVIAVMLLVSIAWSVFVWHMPPAYRSEALILVESQKIPDALVPSQESTELQDRLANLSERILSSDRLKRIIEKFGLYPEEVKAMGLDGVVELMRKDITIKPEKGWTRDRPGAFRVGFQGTDSKLVTRVANHLASFFIEEDSATRERQARGTADFINSQLQDAKNKLDQTEEQVSQYKLEHKGELPQQEQALLGGLYRLQMELQANQDAISRAEQRKAMLEGELKSGEASERLVTNKTPYAGSVTSGSDQSYKKRSDVLQDQYDRLSLEYTAKHPKMQALRSEIEFQRSQEQTELVRQRGSVEALQSQFALAAQELKSRIDERGIILRDIANYQARVNSVPLREQEMAALMRDYEISKTNYKSLLDKQLSAGMATEMEKRQQAERFTVLDPARVPVRPVSAKRQQLYAIGILLGLAAGIGCALGREAKRNALLGEWELPEGITVLGRVPFISTALDDSLRRS